MLRTINTLDDAIDAIEKIQLELLAARRTVLSLRRLLAYNMYSVSISGFTYVPDAATLYYNSVGLLVSTRFHSPHTTKGIPFNLLQTGSIRSNDL